MWHGVDGGLDEIRVRLSRVMKKLLMLLAILIGGAYAVRVLLGGERR